jgi:dihydroxyacetone kinase
MECLTDAPSGGISVPCIREMITVTREVEAGAGVLYIIGNYNGDKFNLK